MTQSSPADQTQISEFKDVFISYSTEDMVVADFVLRRLEEKGIRCWMAPRDVAPGVPFPTAISAAIESAKVAVIILSSNSMDSNHVVSETNLAFNRGKLHIIPFRIAKTEPDARWQYYVGPVHWIDAYPDVEAHLDELRARIEAILNESADPGAPQRAHNEAVARLQFHKLTQKYQNIRLSLGLSLSADPALVDTSHRYVRIRRVDVLNVQAGGYRSYRWLTVRNESSDPTYYLDHQESGENKVTYESMGLICADSIEASPKNPVHSETTIQPNFVQVIRLYFSQPLEPGAETTLFYKLDWAGEATTYWDQELSQSISFTRYSHGVDELDFSVYDSRRVIDAYMTEISPLFEESRVPKPGRIQLIDEEPEFARLHGNGIRGVRFRIQNPTGACYRIVYRLESSHTPTVPDLF